MAQLRFPATSLSVGRGWGRGGGWKRPDPFIAGKSGRGLGVVRKGRELTAQNSQLHPAGAAGWAKRDREGVGKPLPFKLGATGERLLLQQCQAEKNTLYFCVNYKK